MTIKQDAMHMKRIFLLAMIYLCCAAHECTPARTTYERLSKVTITPDPVPVINDTAYFTLTAALHFDGSGATRKLDSVVYQLYTHDNAPAPAFRFAVINPKKTGPTTDNISIALPVSYDSSTAHLWLQPVLYQHYKTMTLEKRPLAALKKAVE